MPDYLFSSQSLSDYVHQRSRDTASAVNSFDAEDILQKPAEDLADVIVAHYRIDLPVLRRDQEVLSEPKETTQTVRDDDRTIQSSQGGSLIRRYTCRHVGIMGSSNVSITRDSNMADHDPPTDVLRVSHLTRCELSTLRVDPIAVRRGDRIAG
jgi:hypothetical protein